MANVIKDIITAHEGARSKNRYYLDHSQIFNRAIKLIETLFSIEF